MFLSLSACGSDESIEELADVAVPVSAYTVRLEALSPITSYSTRVKAMENAAIVARVSARVLSRQVEGGESVEKGDVLISLDPTDTQLALQQATASVSTADSTLSEAQRNYDRGNKLIETGAIAKMEMDALTTALEAAKAGVQSAMAEAEYARVNVGYAEVTAPIDGVVGLVNVSVGDLVGPESGPILSITRQDTVLVDIEVSESDSLTYSQRIIKGEELSFDISLELPNGTIYDHKGSVFSAANAANPSTGTITARIAFANPDNLLIAGQSARILVSEDAGDGRLAVPQSAVQQDQRGAFIMLIGDEMLADQKYIELGAQVDDWWLVEGGIEIGDSIVTQGLQKIRSGSIVTITADKQ